MVFTKHAKKRLNSRFNIAGFHNSYNPKKLKRYYKFNDKISILKYRTRRNTVLYFIVDTKNNMVITTITSYMAINDILKHINKQLLQMEN